MSMEALWPLDGSLSLPNQCALVLVLVLVLLKGYVDAVLVSIAIQRKGLTRQRHRALVCASLRGRVGTWPCGWVHGCARVQL